MHFIGPAADEKKEPEQPAKPGQADPRDAAAALGNHAFARLVQGLGTRDARKGRLDKIISEEARARGLEPSAVRNQLAKMGEHPTGIHFATTREAVIAATQILKNEIDTETLRRIATAEAALAREMDTLAVFEHFPKAQAWRLLMDGKHHAARGKLGFENERGYMAAMMGAFTQVLHQLNTRLTAGYYEQLHDACLNNVLDRARQPMELGYRKSAEHGEAFGVVAGETWSHEGYRELQEKYQQRNRDEGHRYAPEGHPVGDALARDPEKMVGPALAEKKMTLKPKTRSRSQAAATLVLELYEKEIKKLDPASATHADDALDAIVRCCQDLDQVHLFVDGNIRTIAFLVMNKLLLENGLQPAILDEPNIFDCKSVAELKAAVREGQARFASLS
jgi:prophage maintenance system killer protein